MTPLYVGPEAKGPQDSDAGPVLLSHSKAQDGFPASPSLATLSLPWLSMGALCKCPDCRQRALLEAAVATSSGRGHLPGIRRHPGPWLLKEPCTVSSGFYQYSSSETTAAALGRGHLVASLGSVPGLWQLCSEAGSP